MKYNSDALYGFALCVKNAIPPDAEPFDDDGPICAECGTHVNVRDGCDFDPGDLCDACAQVFFSKVREAYRSLEKHK